MQVAVAENVNTPARMFRKRMQHMIKESYTGIDHNLLTLALLCSMLSFRLGLAIRKLVFERRQSTAVERELYPNFGLVSIPDYCGPAGRRSFHICRVRESGRMIGNKIWGKNNQGWAIGRRLCRVSQSLYLKIFSLILHSLSD